MNFSFTLLHGWNGGRTRETTHGGENLLPHQLLLLLSDGSLTTHLEAIYDCALAVEIREQGSTRLDAGDSRFLGAAPGAEAVARGVWLKAEEERLVYAKTLLLTERLGKQLVHDVATVEVPLGRLLARSHPFSRKESIECAVATSPVVAEALSLPDETPFWIRRYLLEARAAEGTQTLRAMVTELFTPELMGTPRVR